MKRVIGVAALLTALVVPAGAEEPAATPTKSDSRQMQQRVVELRSRLQEFMQRHQGGAAEAPAPAIKMPKTPADAAAGLRDQPQEVRDVVAEPTAGPAASDAGTGSEALKELSDDGKATMMLLYQETPEPKSPNGDKQTSTSGTGSANKRALDELRRSLAEVGTRSS